MFYSFRLILLAWNRSSLRKNHKLADGSDNYFFYNSQTVSSWKIKNGFIKQFFVFQYLYDERKNYMKKMMLAGLLLAMSSIVMADSAQDVLKKARDDYYKQQEAAKAPKKAEKKVKAEKAKAAEVVQVEEEMAEEEVKPRTPMEKLEYNANKAAIKVDFYERVVRSVAREEKELDGYNEVLGKKKTAKVKQQKAEKPAKTKKK